MNPPRPPFTRYLWLLLTLLLLAACSRVSDAPTLTPPLATASTETYEHLATWGGLGSGTGDGQFNLPFGVAIDASGNVYVADRNNHRIQKFDSSGTFVTKWGSIGTGDGQFNLPSGVAVDADGNVYVADTFNHRIQKFDSSGTFVSKWGGSGAGDGQFSFPFGVAVDKDGNVYVADSDNHRIQKFDSSGGFVTKWGSSGAGDGQFSFPRGVAVDKDGNVYVADTDNHRIQKFDSSWTFVTKWGGFGAGDGQFSFPFGVAVDKDGNVYVADIFNDRIQKFTSSGTFVTKWGSSGSSDGQFNFPRGVAIDALGKVYVADTENHRIQKFGLVASDTTPPTITLSTPADGAVYLLHQVVTASYTCADEAGGSGLASCVGTVANDVAIDTASVGVKSFKVEAEDNAGNTDSVTHSYSVGYGFEGFFSPVDNGGVLNIAKAGQKIPLKWRLTDASGAPITTLPSATVTVQNLSCSLGSGSDQVEEYAPGASGLQNLGGGYYQFNWATPKSYANTCKTMHLNLGEGMTRTANFKFTR